MYNYQSANNFDVDFIDSEENQFNDQYSSSNSSKKSIVEMEDDNSKEKARGRGLERLVWPLEMQGAAKAR